MKKTLILVFAALGLSACAQLRNWGILPTPCRYNKPGVRYFEGDAGCKALTQEAEEERARIKREQDAREGALRAEERQITEQLISYDIEPEEPIPNEPADVARLRLARERSRVAAAKKQQESDDQAIILKSEEDVLAERLRAEGLEPEPVPPGEKYTERLARRNREQQRIYDAQAAKQQAEENARNAQWEAEQKAEADAEERAEAAKKARCGKLYHSRPVIGGEFKKWSSCAALTYSHTGATVRDGQQVDLWESSPRGVMIYVTGGKIVSWVSP